MADYSSLDVVRRSASTDQPPTVRNKTEVAKLIDVSKCIGCKACQVACEEWNDLRDDIGENIGVYDNPHDLSAKTWTLMRFTEYESTGGELEFLIRKDGCMHCSDPGCLKACPSPGRHRAVCQRHRGFRRGELHRLRLLREGLPVQHSPHLRRRTARRTSARCARTGWRWARRRPAPSPARRVPSCSAPRRR